MFNRWLDRRDERRAQNADDYKSVTDLTLDGDLAFPKGNAVVSVEEFCLRADQIVAEPTLFYESGCASATIVWENGWITFETPLLTDIPENNTVRAKVTESGTNKHAVVVFHHWNAEGRKPALAHFLAWQGMTVVEIAMPYHMERSRPGSLHADYMLGASLGRTVQSMRQAVVDGRTLIGILKGAGYRKVSVLGMSLGSWVAGLVASHDPAVDKAALFLTAGSLADMVWTGRATRHIRESFEREIGLTDLRRAWRPLSLETYADKLARPGLALQVVLATRDTVVLPELSERLIKSLEKAGAELGVLKLNCGHYSLSIPPYIVSTGYTVAQFLKHAR